MKSTKKRAYRRHKGVGIYRVKEMIPGSDCKLNKNSIIVPSTPKYDEYFTLADGSMKSSSLDVIKTDIANILADAEKMSIPIDEMVKTLNEE